jgi:hypothetical protein
MLPGLLAASLLLAGLLAGVLCLLTRLLLARLVVARLVLVLAGHLGISVVERSENQPADEQLVAREFGFRREYCMATARQDRVEGTGCKNSPVKNSAVQAPRRYGCCCRPRFPLLENETTRRSRLHGGPSPRRFQQRFQAKWTPFRLKRARQNETGARLILV